MSGIPIARLLPLVLAGLVLFAVLPVLLLGYLGADHNTSRLLRDRSEMIIDNVVYRIEAHLEPARQQLRYLQSAVERGVVDVETANGYDLGTFVLGALAATPQVFGIGHILPDQSMRRYSRSDYGSHVEEPRRVPNAEESLAAAEAGSEPEWLTAVWSPIGQETILRLVAPLREQGGAFQGALVAAVTTSALSRYLKGLSGQANVRAFILAGRVRVVAHPNLAKPQIVSEMPGEDPLPTIDAVGDPVLAQIWTEDAYELTALAEFREAEGHWTWVGDEAYAYVYRTITGYGGEPWIVGVHLPGAESRRERWTVHGIAIGGAVLLALAVAAAVAIGRRLGRPILQLAGAAERIEALDFANVRHLPRGPIREVNRAATAFERMASGLRLFETYVPRTLVRRLIAAETEHPETESRQLTVMFTDLEGYTDFSAGRPAAEIADYLNEVLASIGPLIEASGGTIDNFMGDGVMAFWGAPEPRSDHADAACRAALDIARAFSRFTATRRAAGRPACRLRIGLHTGTVVVGNIGFAGRVHYTIVGEATNVAQRVEQLGRDPGLADGDTTILISEQTWQATTQPFRTEPAFERLSGRLAAAAPVHRLLGTEE